MVPFSDKDSPQTFNPATLMEQFANDQELLREAAHQFLEDLPHYLSRIRTAFEKNDRNGVKTSTHALKGAASNFHAQALVEAAQTLEDTTKEESTPLDSHLEDLEKKTSEFSEELKKLIS